MASFSADALAPYLTENEQFIITILRGALPENHDGISLHELCLHLTEILRKSFPDELPLEHPVAKRLKVLASQAIVTKYSSRTIKLSPVERLI